MATIGVLTYTLPDGLKLNKNFINKTLNQNSKISEKRINYNKINNNSYNKPNKIINLSNIESLGMIGADVVVMRTKQKLTPLKEPHNNENQSSSTKPPPAKKQKIATINNVTVTTMPLSNILNTTKLKRSLSPNVSPNSNVLAHNTLSFTSNSIIVKNDRTNNPNEILCKPTNLTTFNNGDLDTTAKICGTNTKTNQPVTTCGRKSTSLPQAVARRNARERNRVKQVNNGFAALRQRIPDEVAEAFETSGGRGTNKKLSKVETLRMAVEYIRSLERVLGFEYPANMTSSAGSDGMLSPLPSDDDILFNSTTDFASNLSESSPTSLTPPAQNKIDGNKQNNENSVIKSENCNPQSPKLLSSPEERVSSSFDDANSSFYEQDSGTIYYTDNLPVIYRVAGTNSYQMIAPEILENEENIHPTGFGNFGLQKQFYTKKNNFVDINELINSSNSQHNEIIPQLPLPSMPFTTSMMDQQRSLEVSEYSPSSDHRQHDHEPQSLISPLTINCTSQNRPALIPSPDQFSSQSSNMSSSSYTTNTNNGHNNKFNTVIDQFGDQQQIEKNLLIHFQNFQHQEQQRQYDLNQLNQLQQQSLELSKMKTESHQFQTIIQRSLPPQSPPLNEHEINPKLDFSRTIKTLTTIENASHIYEAINNVVNRTKNDESSSKNEESKFQKFKLERNINLNTEENVINAFEWWDTKM